MGRGGARNAGPSVEDAESLEEEFPFPLTEIDKYNLSITNDEFEPHTWDNLKQIIAENKLETLRRWPSDLKRYIKWSAATKKQYGSIMVYVMQERLHWQPSSSSTPVTGPVFDFKDPVPFKHQEDYKMMPNDWPYGLDEGISHLIVWLKNRLEVEPSRGDLTPGSRKLVDAFIEREFVEPVSRLTGGKDNVLGFKNWVSLQSVPGIDHVHVLVRNVPQKYIDEQWTGGIEPVQNMVAVQ